MTILLLTALAAGQTLRVPGDYQTLDDALIAARAGAIIELAPGEHATTHTITRSLRITGVPGAERPTITTPRGRPALDVRGATLVVDAVTLLCQSDVAVRGASATVAAIDLDLVGCDRGGFIAEGGRWDLFNVRLRDDSLLFDGAPEVLQVERVAAHDHRLSAPLIRQRGGAQVLTDVVVTNSRFPGPAIENTGLNNLAWQRVVLGCNETGPHLATTSGSSFGKPFLLDRVAVFGNHRDRTGDPLLQFDTETQVVHGTFVSDGQGALFSGTAGWLTIDGSILARAEAVVPPAWHATGLVGGGNAIADLRVAPASLLAAGRVGELALYAADAADCRMWDLRPQPHSAARDLVALSPRERDGSVADAGVTGGGAPLPWGLDADADGFTAAVDCDDADQGVHPEASDLANDGIDADCDGADPDDEDADGFPGGLDCDDRDPDAYPGAPEDLGPVDRNCDGWSDPTDPPRLVGCQMSPMVELIPTLLGFATIWSQIKRTRAPTARR